MPPPSVICRKNVTACVVRETAPSISPRVVTVYTGSSRSSPHKGSHSAPAHLSSLCLIYLAGLKHMRTRVCVWRHLYLSLLTPLPRASRCPYPVPTLFIPSLLSPLALLVLTPCVPRVHTLRTPPPPGVSNGANAPAAFSCVASQLCRRRNRSGHVQECSHQCLVLIDGNSAF